MNIQIIADPDRFTHYEIRNHDPSYYGSSGSSLPLGQVIVGLATCSRPISNSKGQIEHQESLIYIVARTKDEGMLDAARRLETTEAARHTAQTECNVARKAAEKSAKLLSQAIEDRDQNLQRIGQIEAAAASLRDALRKLEGDLAKVRAHVGQKTFDEALGK